MKFNFKQAFTYFLNDNKLAKKTAILYPFAAFSILTTLLSLFFRNFLCVDYGIFLNFIFSGYFAINTNLRIFKPENNLPELKNWKGFFINGFKIFCGMFIWLMVTLLATAFVMFFGIIIYGIICTCVKLNGNVDILSENQQYIILFIIATLAIVPCLIISEIVQISAHTAFLTNLKFKSFFDFEKIKIILFKNFKLFLKYFCVEILSKISYFCLFAILFSTVIGILFIPFLTTYYASFISDIEAQFIRYVFNLSEPEIKESL